MKKIFIIIIALTFISCANQSVEKNSPREYQLGAYLWQQRSGEYKALTYQAYNLATTIIKRDLEDKHNRRRAVVFDIDETVLDNSFGGAYEVKNDIPWNQNLFNDWVKKIAADGVPGAVEFINFLVENRVEPIFISNRSVDQVDMTLENFKKLGIKARKDNMVFMSNDWSKEKRRLEIQKKFDIVLYVGDNLTDFHAMFDGQDSDTRVKLVEKNRQEFGTKFIILPNPLYGDWEKSLPKVKEKRDLLIVK
jgi:5'-nucleotidase (lipoprotein e(P4) family)